MCIAQGVSPERGSGLTPLVGDCVGLLASLVGLYIIFSVSRGRARTTCTLDHLPMLFRPHGAINIAGSCTSETKF